MKPIKLEMTAFGSYARSTLVDFQQLEHCLYLITGDTGAGKTTIFDGIMFALYGVASGEGDKKFRTFEMMHCDYVDKSDDTVIKLDFEHMGKLYSVERKFHFKKKRNTGEYEKTTPQAKLWEEDRDVLNGTDAVTDRITELLGMSADQFRKIVMLAQGEFKKFLDADSEDKNRILGELFDNSVYVSYQKIFDRAREKLFRRRWEEGDAKIKRAMEDFILPEDMTGEENEVYTAGHSGLKEALEKLVEKDLALQNELKEQFADCRDRENKLREALGKAEEQNKKLGELAWKKEAYHSLQEKLPDMMRMKEQADRVERAFHKVIPRHNLFKNAEKIYFDTHKKIQDLSEKLCNLEREKTEKKEVLDSCRQENEPVIGQLGSEIAEIEKALPQYDELKEKCCKKQEESKAAEQVCEQRVKAEEDKRRTAEEISTLKEKINELDGIGKTAEQLRTVLTGATEKRNRLTAEGGIKEQAVEIRKLEDDLKRKQTELQGIYEETGKLENIYHTTYQAFIKGQAGLLARKLEQELQEKEEAVCPVCRTVFQSLTPHCFAELVEGTPEQGDVDKARADFENKDRERQKRSDEIARHETQIAGLKENIISALRELKPDCPDWEALDSTSYLEETIKEYEGQVQKAKREYGEAEAQCEMLEELKQESIGKEEELKACEDSLNAYIAGEQEHRIKSSSLENVINELRKYLKYPNREAAEARKDELQKEKEQRTEKISSAEENYREVENQYNTVSGALESNKNNLPGFLEAKDQEEQNLMSEMEEQGFQSLEEVYTLLQQAGETDSAVESWIRSKNTDIKNYENELKNTERRILELERETENLQMVDLEQLNGSIHELESMHEDIQNRLDLCKKQYENHHSTAVTVRNAKQILKETESAWKRLDSLADLAIGVNSEGGKLSFDRYVMGYVFREVLDMANQRLDIMSGGRYELIHEMNADRNNAKAGLEIAVFDMTTGKSRSASSLSGGESFFVSLALALGLSDVVQNHAGGKRLDALFIDEGFGALDSDVLDHALVVLNQLTEGQRLVGIISHVAKLEESIPQQIQVRNSERGSFLKIVS